MFIKADKEKCILCGTCVQECALSALRIKDKSLENNVDSCIECGVCVDVCPEGALTLRFKPPREAGF